VLLELKASLKPRGVLFSSNPRGHNEEGWSQGRYGVYHDLDAWRHYMSVAGFVELSHYYRLLACLANGSRGWRASGAGWHLERSAVMTFDRSTEVVPVV
jgi:hypothetical protein